MRTVHIKKHPDKSVQHPSALQKEEGAFIRAAGMTSKTSYICAPYTAERILNELLVKGMKHQRRTVIIG